MKISTSTPALGHPGRGLDDVDVHAAGVAGARLLQRRGVHGEHADPPGTQRRAVAELAHVLLCSTRTGCCTASATVGEHPEQRPQRVLGVPAAVLVDARPAPGTGRSTGRDAVTHSSSCRYSRPPAPRPRAAGRPAPPRPASDQSTARPASCTVADDHLGGQRQVQQLGQRDRVAAADQLGRGQHRGRPRRVQDHGVVDARPPTPSRARTRSGGSRSSASHPAGGHGVGQRRVRGDDQRRVGPPLRVGQPGQQVGRRPGVGHGEVGAHPDRGQERLVDADLRAPGRRGRPARSADGSR